MYQVKHHSQVLNVLFWMSWLKGIFPLWFTLVQCVFFSWGHPHDMFWTANNLGVSRLPVEPMEAGRRGLCSFLLVLTLTIGRRCCGCVCRGCCSRGRSLGRGWSLIVVRCPEDIHATGRTGLLPLEPGAQAAERRGGRQHDIIWNSTRTNTQQPLNRMPYLTFCFKTFVWPHKLVLCLNTGTVCNFSCCRCWPQPTFTLLCLLTV